jgi:hypothetical protein
VNLSGHQSARMKSDTWLTPPEIVYALGDFDLDPCCPEFMPWETAERMVCRRERDGLAMEWRQPEALAPDGFAVVLDDSSSPRGYWFAAYIDEAKAAGMTKGRVVPIYFNALAAPSSEHRLSKTEEAASRPAEGIINGIPSAEDPPSLR